MQPSEFFYRLPLADRLHHRGAVLAGLEIPLVTCHQQQRGVGVQVFAEFDVGIAKVLHIAARLGEPFEQPGYGGNCARASAQVGLVFSVH